MDTDDRKSAMLITQEQAQLIEQTMSREYQRKLIVFYRTVTPELTSPFESDEELQERIAGAVRRGRDFGLTSAEGLLQYVGLALAAGAAFDDNAAVARLMRLPGSAPELKIKRLLQFVLRELHILDMDRLSG